MPAQANSTQVAFQLPQPFNGRLAILDELRGLAILLLILFHAGGVLVWNNYLHGDLGTCILLGLSGLGLAYGAADESPRTFVQRRLISGRPKCGHDRCHANGRGQSAVSRIAVDDPGVDVEVQ